MLPIASLCDRDILTDKDMGTHFAQETLLRSMCQLAVKLELPLVLHIAGGGSGGGGAGGAGAEGGAVASLERALEILVEEGIVSDDDGNNDDDGIAVTSPPEGNIEVSACHETSCWGSLLPLVVIQLHEL